MATYPPDILRELKDLQRRVQNLETTPQPPNIELSNTATATFDLASLSYVILTATLEDEQGGRTLAQPNITLFKADPATAAGAWPEGADWTDGDRNGIRFSTWFDWANTDNNNTVLKIHIVNYTYTMYYDLFISVNMRFMTRGGAL